MSVLSKIIRKNKKGLIRLGRASLSLATGGVSEKVIQTAKAIGAASKKIRGQTPRHTKAEQVALQKAAALGAPKVVPISSVKATTMPGGAKLKGVSLGTRARSVRGVSRKVAAAAVKKQARKATGAKRKAPTGGKDLKALSASWKAAGKPGTWMGWVKSH